MHSSVLFKLLEVTVWFLAMGSRSKNSDQESDKAVHEGDQESRGCPEEGGNTDEGKMMTVVNSAWLLLHVRGKIF